jgi:hypothetical protein
MKVRSGREKERGGLYILKARAKKQPCHGLPDFESANIDSCVELHLKNFLGLKFWEKWTRLHARLSSQSVGGK